MKFGEKIKKLRDERQMSLSEFAEILGTSKQVLSRYERGENTPKITTVMQYAETLGIPPAFLIDDKVTDDTPTPDYTSIANLRPIEKQRVPMLGRIACGKPIYVDEDRESYVESGTRIKADFCLTCRGDSMIGAGIHDGDIVFIRQQEAVDNGQMAAVIIGDEATLKRVYYYPEKQKLVLSPENSQYEPLVYVGEELNAIRIIGKAIAYQSDIK